MPFVVGKRVWRSSGSISEVISSRTARSKFTIYVIDLEALWVSQYHRYCDLAIGPFPNNC